jgi:hypothetical protein
VRGRWPVGAAFDFPPLVALAVALAVVLAEGLDIALAEGLDMLLAEAVDIMLAEAVGVDIMLSSAPLSSIPLSFIPISSIPLSSVWAAATGAKTSAASATDSTNKKALLMLTSSSRVANPIYGLPRLVGLYAVEGKGRTPACSSTPGSRRRAGAPRSPPEDAVRLLGRLTDGNYRYPTERSMRDALPCDTIAANHNNLEGYSVSRTTNSSSLDLVRGVRGGKHRFPPVSGRR